MEANQRWHTFMDYDGTSTKVLPPFTGIIVPQTVHKPRSCEKEDMPATSFRPFRPSLICESTIEAGKLTRVPSVPLGSPVLHLDHMVWPGYPIHENRTEFWLVLHWPGYRECKGVVFVRQDNAYDVVRGTASFINKFLDVLHPSLVCDDSDPVTERWSVDTLRDEGYKFYLIELRHVAPDTFQPVIWVSKLSHLDASFIIR